MGIYANPQHAVGKARAQFADEALRPFLAVALAIAGRRAVVVVQEVVAAEQGPTCVVGQRKRWAERTQCGQQSARGERYGGSGDMSRGCGRSRRKGLVWVCWASLSGASSQAVASSHAGRAQSQHCWWDPILWDKPARHKEICLGGTGLYKTIESPKRTEPGRNIEAGPGLLWELALACDEARAGLHMTDAGLPPRYRRASPLPPCPAILSGRAVLAHCATAFFARMALASSMSLACAPGLSARAWRMAASR